MDHTGPFIKHSHRARSLIKSLTNICPTFLAILVILTFKFYLKFAHSINIHLTKNNHFIKLYYLHVFYKLASNCRFAIETTTETTNKNDIQNCVVLLYGLLSLQ